MRSQEANDNVTVQTTHTIPIPRFPAPERHYDRRNEAEFRRELERAYQDIVSWVNQRDADPSVWEHGALTGLGDDDHTQYHTDARALTWLGTRSTSDLPEGANLYYTDERVDDRVAALVQDTASIAWTYNDAGNTLSAAVLPAGVDHGGLAGLGDDDHTQYHTDARALTWLGTRSTSDLPEGANLYYTDERVDDRVGALVQDTASIAWTYSDVGNTLSAAVLPAGVDHGGLAGLGDDDHAQYLLVSGSRAMSGALDMGANSISNVTTLTTSGVVTAGGDIVIDATQTVRSVSSIVMMIDSDNTGSGSLFIVRSNSTGTNRFAVQEDGKAIVGIDPGGGESLRVGGSARMGNIIMTTGLLARNATTGSLQVTGSNASGDGANMVLFGSAAGTPDRIEFRKDATDVLVYDGVSWSFQSLAVAMGGLTATTGQFTTSLAVGPTDILYFDNPSGHTWIAETSGDQLDITVGAVLGQRMTATTWRAYQPATFENEVRGSTANGFLDLAGDSGASVKLRLTDAGMLFLGDTVNTNMVVGLSIQQGTNITDAINLKNSLVSHGMTSIREDDTWGFFQQIPGGVGGMTMGGLTAGTNGILFGALAATTDSTKTTSGIATTIIRGMKKNGTTLQAMGATDNVLAVQISASPGGTIWIIEGSGSTWQPGGATIEGNLQVDGTTTLNTVAYTWPGADGAADEALVTDGAGTLSWSAVLAASASNVFTNAVNYFRKADSGAIQIQFQNSTTGSETNDGFYVGLNASEQPEFWNYENTPIRFAVNNVLVMTLTTGSTVQAEVGINCKGQITLDSAAPIILFGDTSGSAAGTRLSTEGTDGEDFVIDMDPGAAASGEKFSLRANGTDVFTIPLADTSILRNDVVAAAVSTKPIFSISNQQGTNNYVTLQFDGLNDDGYIGYLDSSAAGGKAFKFVLHGTTILSVADTTTLTGSLSVTGSVETTGSVGYSILSGGYEIRLSKDTFASNTPAVGTVSNHAFAVYTNDTKVADFHTGGALTLLAPSSGDPESLKLYNSNTTASNSVRLVFSSDSSTTAEQTFGVVSCEIVDHTHASRTGQLEFWTTDTATLARRGYFGVGLVVGSPTGGDKGGGTINVSGDIYKNNSAYTNPDYVFEIAYDHNSINAPPGYYVRTLKETEEYTRQWRHLPGTHPNKPMGMFGRSDWILEKTEEAFLHLFGHESRIAQLEAEIAALRGEVEQLKAA